MSNIFEHLRMDFFFEFSSTAYLDVCGHEGFNNCGQGFVCGLAQVSLLANLK
jgi:hypothetical protein